MENLSLVTLASFFLYLLREIHTFTEEFECANRNAVLSIVMVMLPCTVLAL